jgi:predicted TIM-barrel fold metal-dependent hydrolase
MPRPARFVDAHVHLWDLSNIGYPWLTPPFDDAGLMGSVEPIAATYQLDDYLDDARGWNVTDIVHVDAGAHPAAALDETRWLQGMADMRGMPNAIVAFSPLDDPEVEALLERQASFPNVRGVRHIANWHPDPAKSYTPANLLDDPQWRAGYALLGRYGLSFDFQLYPGQMKAAAALAATHPDIPVIINHAGMPIEEGGETEWRDGLAALAALPHVAIKLSGFGIVDQGWTVESIRPLILQIIDQFGVDRCMFASDFPTDKLFGPFDRHLQAYCDITADFSDDERDALFASNAERLYRIG